jgi:hypothetical protein
MLNLDGVSVTPDDDPPPATAPGSTRAAWLVRWLESQGATVHLIDEHDHFHVDLDGIPDMTYEWADAIAACLSELRAEVRAVLVARRSCTASCGRHVH